jgi:hypothetical protein
MWAHNVHFCQHLHELPSKPSSPLSYRYSSTDTHHSRTRRFRSPAKNILLLTILSSSKPSQRRKYIPSPMIFTGPRICQRTAHTSSNRSTLFYTTTVCLCWRWSLTIGHLVNITRQFSCTTSFLQLTFSRLFFPTRHVLVDIPQKSNLSLFLFYIVWIAMV